MQENNNGSKFIEKLTKKGAKKIALLLLPVVPWILIILIIVILVLALISPVAGFLDGIFSIFDPETGEIDRSKKTFANALLDKEEEWQEKNVQIDKELVLAIALYGQGYDPDDDISLDCEDPTSDECVVDNKLEEESKTHIKNVKRLADGMVKERKIYYCRNQIVNTQTVCDTNGNNCHEEETISYGEALLCGYDDASLCDSVCTPNYQLEESTVYELKTEEEYKTWLKLDSNQEDEFGDKGFDMEQFLKDLDYSIPIEEADKEEFLDETIEDMYAIYYTITNNTPGVNGGTTGSMILSAGLAGAMPDGLIENLGHPFGTQSCSQTACFGVYSSPNCTGHIGVDIVSDPKAQIYSIAAGTVVHTTRNTRQCNPNFGGGNRATCGAGCEGTTITIRHEVVVDGQTMTVYSKYVHLSSLYPKFVDGAQVAANEPLGIIGTTGCSTGIHLHFEVLDANQKNYNPEELLQVKGCNLSGGCEAARRACGF